MCFFKPQMWRMILQTSSCLKRGIGYRRTTDTPASAAYSPWRIRRLLSAYAAHTADNLNRYHHLNCYQMIYLIETFIPLSQDNEQHSLHDFAGLHGQTGMESKLQVIVAEGKSNELGDAA